MKRKMTSVSQKQTTMYAKENKSSGSKSYNSPWFKGSNAIMYEDMDLYRRAWEADNQRTSNPFFTSNDLDALKMLRNY